MVPAIPSVMGPHGLQGGWGPAFSQPLAARNALSRPWLQSHKSTWFLPQPHGCGAPAAMLHHEALLRIKAACLGRPLCPEAVRTQSGLTVGLRVRKGHVQQANHSSRKEHRFIWSKNRGLKKPIGKMYSFVFQLGSRQPDPRSLTRMQGAPKRSQLIWAQVLGPPEGVPPPADTPASRGPTTLLHTVQKQSQTKHRGQNKHNKTFTKPRALDRVFQCSLPL